MITRSRLMWLGLILLTFSLGLVGAGYRSGRLSTSWEDRVVGVPRLEAPEEVDLGAVEFGQLAEAKFQLANRGKSPLVLSEFRSSCACDGLAVREGERYVRLATLTLEPGGVADVRLVQRVRGDVGREMVTGVSFQTNDPARPEVTVLVRIPTVTGGVSFLPTVVAAGTLQVGATFESFVDVFDRGGQDRRVESVTSSLPDLIRVRFQPAAECPQLPTSPGPGQFLGRVVVTIRTERPESANGTVSVHLTNRPDRPDAIEVRGRVARMVETAPTAIVLPRHSDAGVLYKSSCLCRSPFGMPFTLSVRDCPPELAVTIDGADSVAVHPVSIAVSAPDRLPTKAGEMAFRVTLVAHFADQSFEFAVPVTVQTGSR